MTTDVVRLLDAQTTAARQELVALERGLPASLPQLLVAKGNQLQRLSDDELTTTAQTLARAEEVMGLALGRLCQEARRRKPLEAYYRWLRAVPLSQSRASRLERLAAVADSDPEIAALVEAAPGQDAPVPVSALAELLPMATAAKLQGKAAVLDVQPLKRFLAEERDALLQEPTKARWRARYRAWLATQQAQKRRKPLGARQLSPAHLLAMQEAPPGEQDWLIRQVGRYLATPQQVRQAAKVLGSLSHQKLAHDLATSVLEGTPDWREWLAAYGAVEALAISDGDQAVLRAAIRARNTPPTLDTMTWVGRVLGLCRDRQKALGWAKELIQAGDVRALKWSTLDIQIAAANTAWLKAQARAASLRTFIEQCEALRDLADGLAAQARVHLRLPQSSRVQELVTLAQGVVRGVTALEGEMAPRY